MHSLLSPLEMPNRYECIEKHFSFLMFFYSKKLRGSTESVYLLTKSGSSRYEFIFTNLVAGSSAMLNSIVAVHKAYDSSRLYREIRLRSSLLNKGQLRILPKERLHSRYNGVWNLSSDQV